MAAVKMTDRLRRDIVRRIRQTYDTRIAALEKDITSPSSGFGDFIYRLLVPEATEQAIRAVNITWIKYDTHKRFRALTTNKLEFDGDFYFSHARPIPQDWGWAPGVAIEKGTPLDIKLSERLNLIVERDRIAEKVEKLMEQVTSLNQLAKIWPSVVEYVGADVQATLNAKLGPRGKAQQVALDDETKLALMKTRFLNVNPPKEG